MGLDLILKWVCKPKANVNQTLVGFKNAICSKRKVFYGKSVCVHMCTEYTVNLAFLGIQYLPFL